ncbi:relaxase/mobilization nuclease domain-containing protein, partial [Floridanema evergladense]
MIVKLKKGKSARGVTQYVLNKEKAQLLDTNMLGQNPSQLSKEFGVTRSHRPALKTGVVHAMLSVPNDEKLTDAQWKEIANNFREEMGFTDSQYVIARHHDSDNDHVHLVLSRVQFNGDVVSDSWDYVKAEKIARKLEQQYSLSPQNSSWEVRRENRERELNQAINTRINEEVLSQALVQAFEHPDNFLDLKTGRFMAAEDIYKYYKSLGFEPGEEVWINARSPEGKPQIFQGRLGESGIAELWKMRSTGKDADGLTIWQPESAIAQPEKHLREIARTGYDLSTYPNHPVGGIGGKHAAKFNTLFYEIDDLSIEQQQQKLKELETLTGLAPTAVVHSGGKSLHAYYRLDEPVDRDTWLRLQRKLTALQNGDAAIPNPGRAMRLPGVDRLRDGFLKPVEIVEKSDRTFSPTQFEQALDESFPYGLSEGRWQQWRKTKDEAILTNPEEELLGLGFRGFRERQPNGQGLGDREEFPQPLTPTTQPLTPFYSRPPTTFDYKMSGRIPLDVLLTKDDQEVLRAGVGQGNRDNLAFKLARNAIATAKQLEEMGVSYQGDPRQLLAEFAQRCDPPLKQQDVERIWNSASSGNPTPSRSTESLEKAIAWWDSHSSPVISNHKRQMTNDQEQITPEQEQQNAIQFLQNFYSSPDKQFALLEGRPGTGKTYLAQQFLNQLPEGQRVAVLAPTNQIKEMLAQSNPNIDYLTIHQFLKLQPKESELDLEFETNGESLAQDYDLVLVDESSLINDQLWQRFKTANPKKALFLGDRKQLKPVKGEDISPVFREIPDAFELTQVRRFDKEIGGFVEQLRSAIDTGELPKPVENLTSEGKGIATPNRQTWLKLLAQDTASEEFQKNPNYAKGLAFHKDRVAQINDYVHRSIYGDDAPLFVNGEKFVTRRPITTLTPQGKREIIFRNSQIGEVIAATPTNFKFQDQELKAWNLELADLSGKTVKVQIPDPSATPIIQEQLTKLKQQTELLPKGSEERKAAALNYRQLRDAFQDISHPYASTIHSAQGLTIENAYVDWQDLESHPDPDQRAALANVAASRARNRLIVNTQGLPQKLEPIARIQNSPNYSLPITNQQPPKEDKSVEHLGQIEAYHNYGSKEIERDLQRMRQEIDRHRRNVDAHDLTTRKSLWYQMLRDTPAGRVVDNWLDRRREARISKYEQQAMKKEADARRRQDEIERKMIDREMLQTARAIQVLEQRIPELEKTKGFKESYYQTVEQFNRLIDYERKLQEASSQLDKETDTLRQKIVESPYKQYFDRFESYRKLDPELKDIPVPSALQERSKTAPPPEKTSEQPKLPQLIQFEGKLPQTEAKNLDLTNTEELKIGGSKRRIYQYPKDHPDVLTGEKRAGSFMNKNKWEEWQQQQTNTPTNAVINEKSQPNLVDPFKEPEKSAAQKLPVAQHEEVPKLENPAPKAVPEIEQPLPTPENKADDHHSNSNGAAKLTEEQQKNLMENLGRTNLNNPFLDDIINRNEPEPEFEEPSPEQVAKLQEQLNQEVGQQPSVFDHPLSPLPEAKTAESAFDKQSEVEQQPPSAEPSAFDQEPPQAEAQEAKSEP